MIRLSLFAAVAYLLVCPAARAEPIALRELTVALADRFWETTQINKPARLGAADLAQKISLTCGGRVKFVEESAAPAQGPVLYLGPTGAAKRMGVDVSGFAALEYEIKCDGTNVCVASRTAIGTCAAAAAFLGRFCDFYFMTIDEDDPYTVDPARSIGVCDIRRKAGIPKFCGYEEGWPSVRHPDGPFKLRPNIERYLLRNAGKPGSGLMPYPRVADYEHDPATRMPGHLPESHSTFYYVPPEKYAKEHPEYYAMDSKGKRNFVRNFNAQLCYTNPDVQNIIAKKILETADGEERKFGADAPRLYDLTQMDNSGQLCLCPECRKVVAKYDREPGGHRQGGDAGLQMEWVNGIAGKVCAVRTNLMFRIFAYASSEMAPTNGPTLHPNVVVQLCDNYGTSCDILPLKHPFNRDRIEVFEGWIRYAKHLHVWDYMLLGHTDAPDITVDATAADAKYFRDIGVEYLFYQNTWSLQPFWELNTFCQLHMYFDPDSDVERWVDIFLRFYGGGGHRMGEMIRSFRRENLEHPVRSKALFYSGRNFPWKSDPEKIGGWIALQEEAYAAAGAGTKQSARIASALQCFCRLFIAVAKGDPKYKGEVPAVKKKLMKYAAEAAEAFPASPAGREKMRERYLADAERADLEFHDLPKELQGASDLYCEDTYRLHPYWRAVKEWNPKYAHRVHRVPSEGGAEVSASLRLQRQVSAGQVGVHRGGVRLAGGSGGRPVALGETRDVARHPRGQLLSVPLGRVALDRPLL